MHSYSFLVEEWCTVIMMDGESYYPHWVVWEGPAVLIREVSVFQM